MIADALGSAVSNMMANLIVGGLNYLLQFAVTRKTAKSFDNFPDNVLLSQSIFVLAAANNE